MPARQQPGRRPGRPLVVRLIMAVAAVGLFLIGYQWGNQYQRAGEEPPRIAGVLIRPPMTLPEPVLDGPARLARTDLAGRWSLLALASPAGASGHRTVARMVEVANRLADRPRLRSRLQMLLVSADEVPALARDFQRLNADLRVLAAAPSDFEALSGALGIERSTPAAAGGEPPPLFLIGPQARVLALFPAAQPPQRIAEDLVTLAEHPHTVAADAAD